MKRSQHIESNNVSVPTKHDLIFVYFAPNVARFGSGSLFHKKFGLVIRISFVTSFRVRGLMIRFLFLVDFHPSLINHENGLAGEKGPSYDFFVFDFQEREYLLRGVRAKNSLGAKGLIAIPLHISYFSPGTEYNHKFWSTIISYLSVTFSITQVKRKTRVF